MSLSQKQVSVKFSGLKNQRINFLDLFYNL